MNNQQLGLKSAQELVFLHTLGVTLSIHKSQFLDFAKEMHNQGFFETIATPAATSVEYSIGPIKTLLFNRIIDANTTAKYSWLAQTKYPTCRKAFRIKDFDILTSPKFIQQDVMFMSGRNQGKSSSLKSMEQYLSNKLNNTMEDQIKRQLIYGSSITKVTFDDPIS